MKIIVLGDIHGNLPALDVVLREAKAEGFDLICHTGDVAGLAPFPIETAEVLRSEKIPGVRGHVDECLADQRERCGPPDGDTGSQPGEEEAYDWTLDHINLRTRRYLGDLPFEIRLDAGGRRAALVHATPIDAFTPVWENRDEDFFREIGDAAGADLLIFGHTHVPYHRIVDGRHFINAGSVGCLREAGATTGYSVIQANGNVEVQFRRFPYDVQRLLRAAKERGFPEGAAAIFKP